MKRLGFSVVKLASAILVVMCTAAFAAIPSSMNMQGVLRTTSGDPVPDGGYSTTFSLWTDVTGGTQVWTETQSVTTSSGLFTVELGHVVSLDGVFADNSGGALYLETSFLISGIPVTMSPRTPILSVPYSSASTSVQGDMKTKPGSVTITNPPLGGMMGSTTATIRMQATVDSLVEVSTFDDGGGGSGGTSSRKYLNNEDCQWTISCPQGDIKSSVSPTSSSVAINTKGTGADKNRCAMITTPDSGLSVIDYDSDDDGIPESECQSIVTPTTSAVAIKTRGTGADKNRVVITTSQDSATTVLDHDSDNDGIPESECKSIITPGTSAVAINTKGTGADRNRVIIITTQDSANSIIDHDDDGDGVPESECRSVVTPGTSSVAINTKGTGADKGRCAMITTPYGGTMYTDWDADDDGIAEASITQSAGPTSSRLAIKTKGTSAHRLASMSSEPDGFSSMQCSVDIDDDDDGDIGVQCDANESRSVLKTYFEKGDIPTESQSRVTTTTDSSGAGTEMECRLNGLPPGEPVIGTLSMKTTTTKTQVGLGNVTNDSYMEMISSEGTDGITPPSSTFRMGRPAINTVVLKVDGDGLADLAVSGGGKNIGLHVSSVSGQCALAMTDATSGTTDTTIIIDGTNKRFGIGVSDPSYPIEHSSGARLTNAGDWVNASSRDLKENFEAVNGEDVLNKLDELPITQWNYKSEADGITHIGPMAEDFHRTFGLGETDKAISTIDPSGVALAAIKELSKQNKQLKKENDKLQQEIDELQQAVKALLKQNGKGR